MPANLDYFLLLLGLVMTGGHDNLILVYDFQAPGILNICFINNKAFVSG